MKLSDLKTGMIVQFRNGGKYLVVNNCFIANTSHMFMYKYNEDMTCKNDCNYRDGDIMKVWEVEELCNLNSMLLSNWTDEDRFGHMIWDRENEDRVDMTLEEVCEVLGKKVRIIPSK